LQISCCGWSLAPDTAAAHCGSAFAKGTGATGGGGLEAATSLSDWIRLNPTVQFFKPNPSQLVTQGRWVANGRRGRERGRGGFFKKANENAKIKPN